MYYTLLLRNRSSTACREAGYPGISLLAGNPATQVGASAQRVTGPTPTVTLAPGDAASAVVGVAEAGNYSSGCGQVTSDQLKIFPPNQTSALLISFKVTTCSNTSDKTLTVRPLTAG